MSRKPEPSPDTAHPLPSGGGCYEVVAGDLQQVEAPTRAAADELAAVAISIDLAGETTPVTEA